MKIILPHQRVGGGAQGLGAILTSRGGGYGRKYGSTAIWQIAP